MFTYVELINFKSFGRVRFDFKNTKSDFKKFIAIYGENGSGKSNFVSSIELLAKLMTSYMNKEELEKYNKILEEADNPDTLKKILFRYNANQLSKTLKSNRTIDCNDNTQVKYGFIIDNIEGYYLVEFDDETIVKEELYYLNNKQRGIVYSIDKKDSEIHPIFNSFLFKEKKYENDVKETLNMYWGKHTFLSIILGEQRQKNKEFIEKSISGNLFKVINAFMHVFILCKHSNRSETNIISGSNIQIRDFEEIEVKKNDDAKFKQLKKIETIVRDFFTQAYTDIVDIYYDKDTSRKEDDRVVYTLFVKKIVANKVITVPFELESAGTQRLLNILRAILEALNGQTVVYDEIDDGIHDLLMCKVLLSAQKEIKGQLIITTHNTLLLEDLDPKSAYVIYSDFDGNKDARCISDYDIRIQTSHNSRRLYLNGVFGGVPYNSDIDYSQDIYHFVNMEDWYGI